MISPSQVSEFWTQNNFLLNFRVESVWSRAFNWFVLQVFPVVLGTVVCGPWNAHRARHGLQRLAGFDFFDRYPWLTYSFPPFGTNDPVASNFLRVGPMFPQYRLAEVLPSDLDLWLSEGAPVLYVSM